MKAQWQSLKNHAKHTQQRNILSLFEDEQRFHQFSLDAEGLLFDFSKTNIDKETKTLLLDLARHALLEEKRDQMCRGEKINTSEHRAVLHTALRSKSTNPLIIDGKNIREEIELTLRRIKDFSERTRQGIHRSFTGKTFQDVVNIGIGGSDLGPQMASEALLPYHDGPRCHFVSNVDSAHLADTLKMLDAERTLFIITSKTFTTIETMLNAKTAIHWLEEKLQTKALSAHLVAVTSAESKALEMGIMPEHIFSFGDWVGGRYSLWGPVGLPLALAIGYKNFADFLEGGMVMDQHFQTTPLEQNLPVWLGLTSIWHHNICGYATRGIMPYDQRLNHLPAYLQQLEMESNGKSVQLNGEVVEEKTGAIVWGMSGTNGQHAFYQLLHQGTEIIPIEFLIARCNHEPALSYHHDILKANCIAQSEALMKGRPFAAALEIAKNLGFSGDEAKRQAAFRTFSGNKPSTTLVYEKLSPAVLGKIIALYEHKVFVEGVIWNINSFDQWGVELGKELAQTVLPMLEGADSSCKDLSTQNLLERLKGH